MKSLTNLIRRNLLFFVLATIAALALRLFFVFRWPHLSGDTFVYGDIAKNWLNHHIYGVTDGSIVRPTLIRLPGYPGFLALVFSIFGQEHYGAAMILQALIDTNTCLVIAALALELMNERAGKAAYLLAALCPFTAQYSATPLSETLAIFTTAHAFYYGIRGLKALQSGQPGTRFWLISGLWISAAIYMRPESGLILVPFGAALVYLLLRPAFTTAYPVIAKSSRSVIVSEGAAQGANDTTDLGTQHNEKWSGAPKVTRGIPLTRRRIILAGTLLLFAALLPLLPWTIRNWRTFHVFQPLASRAAEDPGEFVAQGCGLWSKTWVVDFVSVDEVEWHIPDEKVDFNLLPERAFDSREEYDKTRELFEIYNRQLDIDPQLDAQFELLARERVNHNPFRYYVWLPSLRIADMWLRPRTEMLNIELRWWEYDNHPEETIFAISWAALDLFFLLAAFRGWLKWRLGLCGAVLVGYIVVRSVFLSTLGNPEPRYVLECFPLVLALAGGASQGRVTTQQANGLHQGTSSPMLKKLDY